MKSSVIAFVLFVFSTSGAFGADDPLQDYHIRSDLNDVPMADIDVYRLWPKGKDYAGAAEPTLTVMRPHPGRANGTAVIIAPGGAYIRLAGMLEGVEPAAWFTAHGATAFVLRYRVGPEAPLPVPFDDAERAMRFVRANAETFDIDPARIGMMGFSAGGHLAATTAVNAKPGDPDAEDPMARVSTRPDFLILGYPWLEGMKRRDDGGSQYCDFAKMAGWDDCRARDYDRFLPIKKVTADMPPTFIYHTTNDELVPVSGSIRFYQALVDHGAPAEFHAFENGSHGTGLGGADVALSSWPDLLGKWLNGRGLLEQPSQTGE